MVADSEHKAVRTPAPADSASTWALVWAVGSIFVAGTAVWLAAPFGLPALCAGFAGWVIAWTVGMGLAVGSLRNAWASATPSAVRRKGWGAVGISAFSLILIVLYMFAIVIAANRIVGG
jgi:cell division protein FtsX